MKVLRFRKLPSGAAEKYELHAVDYAEAAAAHPDEWTLEEPPIGVRVIDLRPVTHFPTAPQIAAPPPAVERGEMPVRPRPSCVRPVVDKSERLDRVAARYGKGA
jgi:hypothetical protein